MASKTKAALEVRAGQRVYDVVADLRAMIAAADFTHTDVAKRLKMDEGQLSRMLSGERDLRLSSVVRLLGAIHTS